MWEDSLTNVSGQSDLECVGTSPDREIFLYIDLAYLNRGYTEIIYLATGSLWGKRRMCQTVSP